MLEDQVACPELVVAAGCSRSRLRNVLTTKEAGHAVLNKNDSCLVRFTPERPSQHGPPRTRISGLGRPTPLALPHANDSSMASSQLLTGTTVLHLHAYTSRAEVRSQKDQTHNINMASSFPPPPVNTIGTTTWPARMTARD